MHQDFIKLQAPADISNLSVGGIQRVNQLL